MSVTVVTTPSLRQRLSSGTSLDNVASVADVIQRLDLASVDGLAILVNGRLADYYTPLRDGDVVSLIPAMSGGA